MFNCPAQLYRLSFSFLTGSIIRNKHNVSLQTIALNALDYRTDILRLVNGLDTPQLGNSCQFYRL